MQEYNTVIRQSNTIKKTRITSFNTTKQNNKTIPQDHEQTRRHEHNNTRIQHHNSTRTQEY